jgi:hypothetical protein
VGAFLASVVRQSTVKVLKLADEDDASDTQFGGDLVDPWTTDSTRDHG